MSIEERVQRIDRLVIRLDQRMDEVLSALGDMARGWEILGSQIGDIHEACCGEKPPSELAGALLDLAAAIDRQGDRIGALIARSPRWLTREEWEARYTATPLTKLRPDES